MFIVFPKKYNLSVDTTPDKVLKTAAQKVPKLNFNELRKEWLMTPVFYGTAADGKIAVHHHAAKKRDLDSIYFSGRIMPDGDKTVIEGRFQRSTKNTIMAIIIMVFWLLVTVVCFTQSIIAGLVCTAVTLLCFWLFFWDEGKIEIIKAYLDTIAQESMEDRS
ncbi:MAG: hypothetical protein LUH57_03410 [Ruminococcus sp.]|nr:hypothetical protein [Ruminococcus sp.]